MNMPDAAELERALNYLRLERVNQAATLASKILRATEQAPKVAEFIDLHTSPAAAFANGVLVGLKIAELREQDAAHVTHAAN